MDDGHEFGRRTANRGDERARLDAAAPLGIYPLDARAVPRRQRAQQLAEVSVDAHQDPVAGLDEAAQDGFDPRA